MKKLFVFALLAILLVGGMAGTKSITTRQKSVATTGATRQTSITVSQTIQLSASQKNTGRSSVFEGKTALDLLQMTASVKTEGAGTGAFVTQINGRQADKSKREFWSFYVNNKPATVGAGSYKLHNNDSIVWKIENY